MATTEEGDVARQVRDGLVASLESLGREVQRGWVRAPPSLTKNIFRLRLRAATICPLLEWLREPGAEGAVLHFTAQPPSIEIEHYTNTYMIDWREERTQEMVQRGDTQDPTIPPPPVNGVPFKEKAKDKKARLAREAREAMERNKSFLAKSKSVIQKLPLTNRTAAPLSFKVYCEPPGSFSLGLYSTPSTGSLEGQEEPMPEGAITLQPGSNVITQVKFNPPPPSDREAWPAVRTSTVPGNVVVEYVNGFQQRFELSAVMLRPLLLVEPSFFDFNLVNTASEVTLGVTKNKRQTAFVLHNASDSPAKWSVCHLPRKQRFKDVSAMDTKVLATFTNPEFEQRYDWADDPAVFQFNDSSGVIPPQSRHEVVVTFKPTLKEDFFSVFRFVTPFTALDEQDEKDESVATVSLLGTGEFGEDGDHDYDYHY